MKALQFGTVRRREVYEGDNPLLRGLARTPMALVDLPDPSFLRADWVITRPRLTGICGSDAKQVFMDWGGGDLAQDNPMLSWSSYPHVLGHEVVADVVELGPEAQGVSVGDRVVLNPWLSCVPRGVDPVCSSCAAGDLSLCQSFTVGPISPGIHIGTCKDATGGYAELMAAHPCMLHRVPTHITDEEAVLADPFAVSLHAVTRHPPSPGGRAMVYGAGALGLCATAILRALYPDVEVVVVARFDAQASLARSMGATVVSHEPALQVIEEVARWSGSALVPSRGLPMAFPGAIDVVYDTVGKRETFEVGTRLLRPRGTLVKAGVHGPTVWEDTPLYVKELCMVGSNAFGIEEVGGTRKHGIDHYLDLVTARSVDVRALLTDTFTLAAWEGAFTALATQAESSAIKVAFDQRAAS
jgi:threonine dehydrogenase-like Zn-dependent dehydrogenase